MSRPIDLLLALLPALLLAARASAQEPRLEELRLASWEQEGARATIELSDSTRVRHFYLGDGPQKLVLDFYDTVHALKRWNHPDLRAGPVTGVRSSQYRPRPEARARVVFDLALPCDYRVETRAGRTTVELQPSGGAAPSPAETVPIETLATAPPRAEPAPALARARSELAAARPAVAAPSPFAARLRGVSAAALQAAASELGLALDLEGARGPIRGDVDAPDSETFCGELRRIAREH